MAVITLTIDSTMKAGSIVGSGSLGAATEKALIITVEDFVRLQPRLLIVCDAAWEWHGRVSGSSQYYPVGANEVFPINLANPSETFYLKSTAGGTVRLMIAGKAHVPT